MSTRIRDRLVAQYGEALVDYVAPSKRKPWHKLTDEEKQHARETIEALPEDFLSQFDNIKPGDILDGLMYKPTDDGLPRWVVVEEDS